MRKGATACAEFSLSLGSVGGAGDFMSADWRRRSEYKEATLPGPAEQHCHHTANPPKVLRKCRAQCRMNGCGGSGMVQYWHHRKNAPLKIPCYDLRKKKSENSQSPSFSPCPNLRRQFFRKREGEKNGVAYSDFGSCAEKGIRMGARCAVRRVLLTKMFPIPHTLDPLLSPPLSPYSFLDKVPPSSPHIPSPHFSPTLPIPPLEAIPSPSSRFASFLFRLGKGLSKNLPGGKKSAAWVKPQI